MRVNFSPRGGGPTRIVNAQSATATPSSTEANAVSTPAMKASAIIAMFLPTER